MPIYLDYNATTPVLPEVVDAMLPFLREHFGNPSSSHAYGKAAREAVGKARAEVAALIGASPDEIVFTSGGTEANNLAIRGAAEAGPARRHLVTSVVEHPATEKPCAFFESHGYEVTRLSVDPFGRVEAGAAAAFVRGDTLLVTVMHANNEVGTVQPIRKLSDVAHARGALVHTDAAQSVGKVPVSVDELGVDLLSIAGHKLYAPKGVGALFVRRGTPVAPFALGAGHERGLRPGTENVASIAGLGMACEIARAALDAESGRVKGLRDRLWKLLKAGVPGLALNGHPVERLPNTLNVRFPGVRGGEVLARAPEIAASTGSACHEGGESASAVLLATGIDPRSALGSVRLSLGRGTTPDQVETAAAALVSAWRETASAAAGS
ncbi:MAG: cysteine desulfurase [Deltaproteobacteria bacterium]|nr:cysteine desulfurase [Deltaproteobacteria bacterium]